MATPTTRPAGTAHHGRHHLRVHRSTASLLLLMAAIGVRGAHAQDAGAAPSAAAPAAAAQAPSTISCESKAGGRTSCPANTSAGVVLVRSRGDAACLLGRTWGYDQASVWVSDGCSADFATGAVAEAEPTKQKAPFHVPNVGFLLFDGEKGQVYFRLFSYGAVPQSAEPRRDVRRRVRQHEDHPAAPGRPAAEVLRAVLGMVPHPEDALLPLCLVLERVAGRPGAGRGRGQPDLGLQPPRERRGRHHLAADRAQHRRPVPLLARRGRSPDRRRVLPRVVHLRRVGQGRAHTRPSSTT